MADPYYPFYPGDYQRDTRGLTLIENGAYRVLLDEYYMNGPISSDLDRIYRIVGAINEDERQAVNFVIKKYFVNENGFLRNKRADNEREKRDKFLKSQTEKSALGVKARRSTRGSTRRSTPRLTPPSPSPSPSSSLSSSPEKDIDDSKESLFPEINPGTCPQQKIISIYHEKFPELAKVISWPDHLQRILKTRWKEDPVRQNLDWWGFYFDFVRQSSFLMGKETDFIVDLEWIMRPKNMTKILNGRYHQRHPLKGKVSDKTIKTIEHFKEWLNE